MFQPRSGGSQVAVGVSPRKPRQSPSSQPRQGRQQDPRWPRCVPSLTRLKRSLRVWIPGAHTPVVTHKWLILPGIEAHSEKKPRKHEGYEGMEQQVETGMDRPPPSACLTWVGGWRAHGGSADRAGGSLPQGSCRSRGGSHGPQGSWMIPPVLSSTSTSTAALSTSLGMAGPAPDVRASAMGHWPVCLPPGHRVWPDVPLLLVLSAAVLVLVLESGRCPRSSRANQPVWLGGDVRNNEGSRPRLHAVAAVRLKTQPCNGCQRGNFCAAGASLTLPPATLRRVNLCLGLRPQAALHC